MTKNKFCVCMAVLFLMASCNTQTIDREGVNNATRNQKEELDFVRTKATKFEKNTSKHWEAELDNGITFIYVPEGSFTMGNNANETALPEHKVNLSHYWISKTPITTGQFREFVEETGYKTEVLNEGHTGPYVYDFEIEAFKPKYGYYWDNAFKDILAHFPEITIDDSHPVSSISWNDAVAYTQWLSKKTALEISLPTEAEWEYAAKGTDGRIYPWGNEIPDGTRANYADETMQKFFPNLEQAFTHFGVTDGYAITSPVGSFPAGASPVGALDMAGNLTEWVYDSAYKLTKEQAVEVTNPINTIKNGENQEKGGLWCGSAGREGQDPDEIKYGHNVRTDTRPADETDSADDHMGFRIAISYTKRN
ncbi:SUMF1/EgtB/PvdO family nonheme iron enzyme [Ulvibacterium sp.]|uniref:formylglycine-generating enzyme family protein n=1 Tax=Ulvibacterium sp. TaxID=2665914 RepID=UPI0026279CE2|nr:SUMF1/EgtB/PvdO family nonheme iron enzyme [Ulvibacterium sp.]